jgi:hypothetical protein
LENVDFLDVGVVLSVTPWITRDGGVIMEVKPEVSSGQINPDTELPEEETTEVETALMLPDGHGMVIGGLIQEENGETQQKIPIVGDLWIIGRLFQRRTLVRKRSEIIIALVPHVVPYQPIRRETECEQFQRATKPLFYGPLLENPRPGEPKLPDAGQKAPFCYKLQHFCPPPDHRGWSPRGSYETCHPGTAFFDRYSGPARPPYELMPAPEPAPDAPAVAPMPRAR